MTSINDLVSGVINRIDSIPSSITGSPIIYELLNDARIDVQNILDVSIGESDVAEKYQPIIKNIGAAYTLSRMTGIGVDFDYSLGNFRVSKSSSGDPDAKQLQFFIDQANRSINGIGRTIPYKATFQ